MLLNESLIREKLSKNLNELKIYVYNSIDSTNTQAKILAEDPSITNAILIAEEQTAGRGRMGRSFSSQGGKGLYMSILLKNGVPASEGIFTTTYMATVAARVIRKISGISPKIKWVNDIYAGGKKLSGILTEGKINLDGTMAYCVCGIGINLLKQSFPKEISAIATTLEDECGTAHDINGMAAELINEFFMNLHLIGSKEIADEYRAQSMVIGEKVTVIKVSESYDASVLDITDKCELLLLRENGERELLSTGEVSIRKKQ